MSGLWEELRNPQIFCKNDPFYDGAVNKSIYKEALTCHNFHLILLKQPFFHIPFSITFTTNYGPFLVDCLHTSEMN